MKLIVRLALGLALLVPMLEAGKAVPAQQSPKTTEARGIEVGKAPFLTVATSVCGPLEKEQPFDPATYGKVRGYAPINSLHPPAVLYATALTPEFFQLAKALDALIEKDPTWANTMVILSDEKGAQRGGYGTEELLERRKSISKLAEKHHITHLSFFLSAQGAQSVAPRLELADKQDLLLAVLDNRTKPSRNAPVLSAQRLESSKLTAESAQKIVEKLAAPKS